ncbi:hypothetical protein NW759_016000 [Fusarium solani]|nr:hypothetical protein NW759_016000 [Fusarium solani]
MDGLTPLSHCNPLPAELEIKTFGRQMFEDWDVAFSDRLVISCPLMMFMDGFGLYRNTYRTLMGIYTHPGLPFSQRMRPVNVFPIVLGPHGSNFEDVVRSLGSLMPLDRGIEMTIHGRKITACVFTMCFLGDMLQQDKDSAFKGPRGLKFCRFCFVGTKQVKEGGILSLNTKQHSRYHFQHLKMRQALKQGPNASQKSAYATQWGLSDIPLPLRHLTPALNVIMTRSPDPAHSEFKGLPNLMHKALLDVILTNSAKAEYTRRLGQSLTLENTTRHVVVPVNRMPGK